MGVTVSPEYVSSLNKELDKKVKEFLETRIEDRIKYLYFSSLIYILLGIYITSFIYLYKSLVI